MPKKCHKSCKQIPPDLYPLCFEDQGLFSLKRSGLKAAAATSDVVYFFGKFKESTGRVFTSISTPTVLHFPAK